MNDIYRLMYSGGLMLAIFFLLLTVFLFFWLKIPKVFDELTGRSEKKGIRHIREHGDFAGDMSKRERYKYYARESENIKVKKSSYSYTGDAGFLDKTKKDKTSGKLKKKKYGSDEYTEEQSDELKFSQGNAIKEENVNFSVDSDDPETGLLYSNDAGDEIVGVEKRGSNSGSEAETAVLAQEIPGGDIEEETSVLASNESADEDTDEETSVLSSDEYDDDDQEETSILFEEAETSVLAEEKILAVANEYAATEEKVEGNQQEVRTSGVRVIYDIVVVHSDEVI